MVRSYGYYIQQCFPRQMEQAEPRRPHTVIIIIIYSAKHKKVFVIDLQTGRVFAAAAPRRDGTVIYGKGGENKLAKPKK
jgi:hypothetical protein